MAPQKERFISYKIKNLLLLIYTSGDEKYQAINIRNIQINLNN
jgi:hypothetical protein